MTENRSLTDRIGDAERAAALTAALGGRYRIERELGQGGMATVYLADDVRHDRKVAIKVLKPELAAVLGAERFLRRSRPTASLQHPHILPLFDSGDRRRLPLLRHALHRGRDAARQAGPGNPARRRRSGQDRARGRRRARLRAPARRDPPRHQAREHPAARRPRHGRRLRDRARGERRRRRANDRNRPVVSARRTT